MPEGLAAWAARLEGRTPSGSFELGLTRIARAVAATGIAPPRPLITVAGTNGKGSTCRHVESVLCEAGYRPGCFYSPHLHDFAERVRVDGGPADEALLVEAFEEVEAADARRGEGEEPLSYFEFVAVAAARAFCAAGCKATVLEVGLGGRLDAVNAFDADVAVITSVDIDHTEHLGPDRESIGAEKAGILREGIPVVVGDRNVPASVLARADELGCEVALRGRDFAEELVEGGQWNYRGKGLRAALPRPPMHGRHQYANAACALAALEALDDRLPVSQAEVRNGIAGATLPGRFEVLPGPVPVVLDVAHNVQGARALDAALLDMGYFTRTVAVFGARARKDAEGIVGALAGRIDEWHVAPVKGEDAGQAMRSCAAIRGQGGEAALHDSVAAAAAAAHASAKERERIVVFGSFMTVTEYSLFREAGRKAA